jgi:hypothetical protein
MPEKMKVFGKKAQVDKIRELLKGIVKNADWVEQLYPDISEDDDVCLMTVINNAKEIDKLLGLKVFYG